ncbi:L-aspartate oxidase [Paracoccus laeviglucosivorans]|uniref:L-aspartate oxidase n=1 Tax=Paracoccus laeviglucosivorans TaxID=1197861 RepID=A0A521BGC4_9RHOB|nr:L-aspartate oxidase [Paracoccus laeviglucosivorans]SMO46001.1 L-aspartate oxidase [Paracoccus laeviglucosivorans]
MMPLSTGRIVILGAGLAALSAALRLAPRPVLVVSPDPLGQGASSAWAQGGVAAAMDPADTPEAHADDTLRAGAGLVDAEVARLVTQAARGQILDLTARGAPFDRDDAGGYVLSREAAHSASRVVRVGGDRAGAEIMRALIAAVRMTPSVQVLEGVLASGLEIRAGRVVGVRLMRAPASVEVLLQAPAVLLAAGGSGGLYALTTNPARVAGQAVGMAARAGAVIADAEFVQFHPTAMDVGLDPAPLATEALRGEGAHLVNAQGARFMLGQHPDAELAPRDVVARAVYLQSQAGLRPALDTRHCLGTRITSDFPSVAGACARAGIDPTRAQIPVAAAAHYHMGGVASDRDGRSSLPGLWVCGEAASTGLHGANRLASNGLLEALVYSARCAASIADAVPAGDGAAVQLPHLAEASPPDPALVARLRSAMTAGAGVVRDAAGLNACLHEIAAIEAAQPDCPALLNMTATATLICAAALARRESRGAHFRSDYPQTEPTGQRSRMTLTQASASLKETA